MGKTFFTQFDLGNSGLDAFAKGSQVSEKSGFRIISSKKSREK
jgi:hypothetical protein